MIDSGYQKGQYILNHPFGKMYRIYKDEYQIHFEKCLIEGTISQELFSQLHKLKHLSQIVEYESQKEYIIIENVNPLPEYMTAQEIKKMMIDMLTAIELLKEYHISLEYIQLPQIYQCKNHYKLDCYCIGHSDYKKLIQDICNIGLNIIDSQEKSLYNILMQYVNIKYQISCSKMIKKIDGIQVSSKKYAINNEKNMNYRKDKLLTSQLPYYILSNYLLIIIIIVLLIVLIII